MDAILPQLLSFPPQPAPRAPYNETDYDLHIRKYLEILSKIPAKKLTQGVSEGDDLLEILDPSVNTLPYLHALLAHINGSSKGKQSSASTSAKFQPGTRLWTCMLKFVQHFDPIQIRYSGYEFRHLLQNVEIAAMSSFKIEEAISPLSLALRRLDPSGATLTSLHVIFARLCLRGRLFSEAKTVLDRKIRYFPSTSDKAASNPLHPYSCSNHDTSSTYISLKSGLTDKLDYRDHLKYHLYGAIVYMALKEWDKALLFLDIVLFTPTNNTASLIQAEAYRKWVLVCLISKGKRGRMPSTSSSQAIRMYHSLSKAYDGLAQVFEDSLSRYENASRLVSECQVGHQFWIEDSNAGLVRQVVEAYRRFSVMRLGAVYAAMPMSGVARHISRTPEDLNEATTYISGLISSGHLNASLEHDPSGSEDRLLRFRNSISKSSAPRAEGQFADLIAQVERIKDISGEAQLLDKELGLSKESIQATKKARAGADSEAPNGMEDLMNEAMIDEDMMEDL